jgi:EAL domain-containing protein (putative c-di-GMP-specific phosphodiesterase class I)
LRNADSAMYHSKEQGRNTYSFFNDSMNADVSRRLLLEEQMHGAIERGEFHLVYQPQVRVSDRELVGAEALLRWDNPALGRITPDEFIPIAEQTGMIVPIGRFVMREALHQAAIWQSRQAGIRLSVNLSPRQFRDPRLVEDVRDALKASGFPCESFELEITEGVLMGGHSYIDDALAELNAMGIAISMDDFGTGYSSLSYLRSYPFEILKIDRSFINDITLDRADLELVTAAIAMAHGLGLEVIAEGVETEEQLALLLEQGCDLAQGYLFSRPVEASEMLSLLEDRPARRASGE